jgi:hypothetical protein
MIMTMMITMIGAVTMIVITIGMFLLMNYDHAPCVIFTMLQISFSEKLVAVLSRSHALFSLPIYGTCSVICIV